MIVIADGGSTKKSILTLKDITHILLVLNI